MKSSSVNGGVVAVLVLAGVVWWSAPPAAAHSSYVTPWRNAYPTSTLTQRMQSQFGGTCYACHQPPDTGEFGTCYKDALVVRLNAGRTISQAIADVDGLDSDGDGVSNHDEILAVRADMTGQVGYHPGLIGPTGTDPCGPSPNQPVTNVLETPPPPSCPADFNGDNQVDFFDYLDFVNAYGSEDASADFNGDNQIDFFDYLDFVNAFDTGC
jgi:hypothetical protein